MVTLNDLILACYDSSNYSKVILYVILSTNYILVSKIEKIFSVKGYIFTSASFGHGRFGGVMFFCIFTLAFLLFLVAEGSSNPVVQSFTLA